ncbi:unnamed protein product, partial [Porites evermanni]
YCPSNSSLGPKKWGDSCSGSQQSPIDISTTAATYDSSLGNFTLVNYANTPAGVNFTAKNSGKSLKVAMDSHIYNVSGGGLRGVYTTVQFHLHWGSNNNKGSEHTMDGLMYPAEIHFVSMNTKYSSLGDSLGHSDGLAVLGVFLKVGSSEHRHYKLFLDHVSSVINKGESVNFPAFPLMNLLPINKTKYFRYPGSLTTPPCSEAVTWTVFKDPIEISQAQLDALRSMKMNSTMNIVDNYRPVLDLGSRKLKASFDEGLKQADPTAAGVVLKISNVVLLLVLFLGAVF